MLMRSAYKLMRRAYKLKGNAYKLMRRAYKLKRDADMLMRSAYKLKNYKYFCLILRPQKQLHPISYHLRPYMTSYYFPFLEL